MISLLSTAALALVSLPVSAATVSLGAVSVLETPFPGGGSTGVDDSDFVQIDTSTSTEINPSVEAFVGFSLGNIGALSASKGSFNISSGEMKAVSSHLPVSPSYAGGYTSLLISVTESFSVTGTGTVTARLVLTGSWDYGCSNLIPSNCISAIGAVGFSSPSQSVEARIEDTFEFNFSPYTFRRELSTTIDVNDSNTYGFAANLSTNVSSGAVGTVDLGSTGYLSLLMSDGVNVSFNDPRFLSEPSTPPPVISLPGSGVILMTAVLLLLAFPRQRKSLKLVV